MKLIELCHIEHATTPARHTFTANGKRISRAKYWELSNASRHTDTFLTARTKTGWRHYKTTYQP